MTALSRHTDPGTSAAAARSIGGIVHEHEAKILSALAESISLAAEQIADRCALTHVQVSRRLKGMTDRGLIERTGEQHQNRSGRQADKHRLTRQTSRPTSTARGLSSHFSPCASSQDPGCGLPRVSSSEPTAHPASQPDRATPSDHGSPEPQADRDTLTARQHGSRRRGISSQAPACVKSMRRLPGCDAHEAAILAIVKANPRGIAESGVGKASTLISDWVSYHLWHLEADGRIRLRDGRWVAVVGR